MKNHQVWFEKNQKSFCTLALLNHSISRHFSSNSLYISVYYRVSKLGGDNIKGKISGAGLVAVVLGFTNSYAKPIEKHFF